MDQFEDSNKAVGCAAAEDACPGDTRHRRQNHRAGQKKTSRDESLSSITGSMGGSDGIHDPPRHPFGAQSQNYTGRDIDQEYDR